MTRRVPSLAVLAAMALIACGKIGAAQQPTQAQADAIRQSCRADYQSHCSTVPPGGSAALQCLRTNLASLSPGCQNAVGATGGTSAGAAPAAPPSSSAAPAPPPPGMPTRQQAMMMRQACGMDFRRWCQGVGLGGGRALACLADHRESLSQPCRDALGRMRGQ
jgi:hypothetical protein